MKNRLSLCVFGLMIVTSGNLLAQTMQVTETTGTPLTIYHGSDIDSVNTTSGNLRISLPLLHLKGRGLDTDFVLSYNSKLWFTYELLDSNQQFLGETASTDQYATSLPRSNWQQSPGKYGAGWSVGIPRFGSFTTSGNTCTAWDYLGNCISADWFGVWIDSGGTRSQMVNDNSSATLNGSSVTGFWSNDGSYIHLLFGNTATWNPKAIHFKDGVTVTQNASTLAETLEDTNGNFITCQMAGNGSGAYTPLSGCTDTLGRQISFLYDSNGLLHQITYKDSNGATQAITFTMQSFQMEYPWISQAPCASSPCPASPSFSQYLPTNVALPNGRSYSFQYVTNSDGTTTGEVSLINLPTGGYIRYTYGSPPDATDPYCYDYRGPCTAPAPWIGQNRVVATRTVSSDGTAASEKTWNYALRSGGSSKVTDPIGNIQTIQLPAWNSQTPTQSGVITFSSPSGLVLRTINQQIGFDNSSFCDPGHTTVNSAVACNPRHLSETTTLNDTNQQSQVAYTYGSYGNVATEKQYDLGSGTPGPLLRTSSYTYLHDSNSAYAASNVNILDRVITQTICNPAGTFCAQTNTTYDGSVLTPTTNVVQHDYSGYPSTNTRRGNPTQVSRKVNTTWLTTTTAYNDVGNPLQSTDAAGHTTSFSYTDNFYSHSTANPTSAFATKTTRPVTNGINHISSAQYYFDSGLPAALCGENFPASSTCTFGLTPQSNYATSTYDLLNRPRVTIRGDGGQTIVTYNDAAPPLSATVSSSITNTANLLTTVIYDGLGRPIQKQLTSDPQGTVFVDTAYDALGRVSSISNPHRGGTDPTSSPGTTTFIYDALGRKCVEVPPDGTLPTGGVCPASQPANDLFTAYSGNTTTVMDQTGRSRKSVTDGLDRLTQVFEDPAGLNYETDYSYDVLGNLLTVNQKGGTADSTKWRTRTFTYDSLSRLLTSNNPEVGIITYKYDSDGNCASPNSFPDLLVSKTDARGIRTCEQYDAIKRETVRNYSNGDPAITTTYDQSACLGLAACQNIGQPTSRTDAAGAEAWSYQADATNHRSVHVNQRTTSGVTRTSTYYLDLASNVYQVVYPTGRVVNYSFDNAGRPSKAVDGSNGITYATDFQTVPTGCLSGAVCYTPQGTFYALSIGQSSSFTGLNLTHTYNNRLQPNEFKASSSGGNAIDISYSFLDPSSMGNSGNVYSIANNLDSSRSQTFSYDNLNRITSALTTSTHATSPAHCWGETYTLDAWGNLTSIAPTTNSNYIGCSQESGFGATADGGNHLSIFAYDPSGNTQSDATVSYTWDAESQLKSATSSNGTTNYIYDGDDRRLSKVGSRLYWYGSGGDILAETDASGNTTAEYIFFGGKRIAMLPAGGNPVYYLEDMLGTSRVLTTNSGVVCYDADFYPYGGERPYTNTCPQNYKFEGKERDPETGNDDFGARYYSNRFGRWLSADWSGIPVAVPYANLTNPQTLNLYSMVADDPESFADLDGHCDENGICGTLAGLASGINNLVNSAYYGIVATLKDPFTPVTAAVQFADSGLKAYETKGISGVLSDVAAQGRQGATEIVTEAVLTGGLAAAANASSESSSNIAANAEKGTSSEARVLSDIGETKNTQPVSTSEGKSIPDFQNNKVVGEIKDAKTVSNTKQLRIQKEAAQNSGRQHELHTGTNTHVTKQAQRGTRVVRRNDLGPKKKPYYGYGEPQK